MKNKSMLIGFVIFAGGTFTGYLIGMKRLKAQFQADVAEVKDFYAAKIEELGVMPEGFDPSDIIEESEDLDDDDRDSEEYLARVAKYSSAVPTGQRGKGRLITNYSKPPLNVVAYGEFGPDDDGEGDVEEPDETEPDPDEVDEVYEAELDARAEEFAQRMHENKSNGLPYVISFDEFEEGPEGYGRQTLYYYSLDRVLCEDDDTLVEDEEGLVGLDYEDTLDMQTTAWVRNDQVLVLYEIHRIDESYSNMVANAQETPKEREYRIIGRRKQGEDNR